jgi:RsiW-degrading membrane proteinase PrsW (M82 family)
MSAHAVAILEGRTPGRTSVPLIIGFIVAGAGLLVGMVIYVLLGGPIPTAVGFGLALPTTAICIGLVLQADRLEPEPRKILAFVFLYGAGLSTVIALVLNSAGEALLFDPRFGARFGGYLTATVAAPLVEETLKGSVFVWLFWRRRAEIDGPTDGIIYAAMVGLGFAFVENINYYMSSYLASVEEHDWGVLVGTVLERGVASPLCHPLFTSMTGLGVAYAATHNTGVRRLLAVVGGWLAAVVLHGLWNGSSILGVVGSGVAYLIDIGVIAVLVVLIVSERRRVVALVRRYIPQYVGTGAVTRHDLPMLGGMAERRHARHFARTHGGMIALRAMGDYQLAVTELALLHARAEKRAIGDDAFRRRQRDLVALLRATHDAAVGEA